MTPGSDASDIAAAPSTDSLFEEVYARLKAMAARHLAQTPRNATLETTALVHELYLRISANRELKFAHRAQFFAYAAHAMRHLLADRARDRLRLQSGGDWQRITLTGADSRLAIASAGEALALGAALDRLEQADARASQVLELHYFAGLTAEQVAETLGLARSTIDRDWRFARAFLKSELGL